MKGTKIVIVKPYTSECHQLTVGKRSPRDDMLLEQKYGASPNRVNLPGEDLFIQNREDVAQKLTLRRKKGYFNEPKDMSKILKAKPKAVKFKSITNPEFTIQNNLKYNQTVVLGDNFKNIAHPSEPSKKIHTSKYNISEFKITGLGDDTAMTIQQSREPEAAMNNPNEELSKILRNIGFKGIREYYNNSIWRNQGKK